MYREYLAASQRTLGPENRNVAIAMQDLATLLIQEGRLSEGEKLSRQALAIRVRSLGPEHPETLLAQVSLVDLLVKEDGEWRFKVRKIHFDIAGDLGLKK